MKKTASFLILIALASVMTMQNCGGTRFLSTSLDVPRATIDQQLTAVQGLGASSVPDTASSASIATFFQILNEPESVLFYSEAPGSMGDMGTVFPLDFGSFNLQTPAKAKAYFVYSPAGSPHGAVMITSVNGTAETPIIAMANDGQNFTPGSFGDANFTMEMGIGSGSLDVESYDVVDGDFAETLQLEVYNFKDDGSKEFLGPILFTQPTN